MSAVALSLLTALAPCQDPAPPDPPAARVALLGGLVGRDGRLALGRLGLGDGGLRPVEGPGRAEGDGRFRTSGGVLVRALPEGVKLDFPGGGELLVDPRGRVHLRGGERTLPSIAGVRIALLDGAFVDVVPQNGSDHPLRLVSVHDGPRRAVLWQAGRGVTRRSQATVFHGRVLHAFGDGRALYELADVGPALVADQVLAPAELRAALPPTLVALIGDVLARSLVEFGEIARQRAAGDPRTQQIAAALASNAAMMFARTKERPAGARGDLVIPLDAGFRMHFEVPAAGPAILALLGQGDEIPLCEWTTTNLTRLHLIQRDAGADGGPRYLMRGHALNHLLEPLLGYEPSPTARARARRTLAALDERAGGGAAVELPVRRQR
jgi:hypothetical protein